MSKEERRNRATQRKLEREANKERKSMLKEQREMERVAKLRAKKSAALKKLEDLENSKVLPIEMKVSQNDSEIINRFKTGRMCDKETFAYIRANCALAKQGNRLIASIERKRKAIMDAPLAPVRRQRKAKGAKDARNYLQLVSQFK